MRLELHTPAYSINEDYAYMVNVCEDHREFYKIPVISSVDVPIFTELDVDSMIRM